MITCDFDGRPDVQIDTKPKAAKDHTCGECHGVIRKGERYELLVMLFDGCWSRDKTCMDCAALRCDITRTYQDKDSYGCGWTPGGMREQLEVMIDGRWKGHERLVAAFNAVAPLRGYQPVRGETK